MDGPTLLEHPKDFIDPATQFGYDAMLGLEYIATPQSPFGLGLQQPAGSPRLSFEALNMPMNDYAFSPAASYSASSPGRPYTPSDGIYPAALTSAGEMSSDSMGRQPSPSFVIRHARRGSTASPLSTSSAIAAVPRSAHRYNPMAPAPTRPATRERKSRKAAKAQDDFASDDEEDEYAASSIGAAVGTEARREEIRRQRIESEQRRRDELRDGYRRLKDALPVSNQKSSKVCLLDRATTHVKFLEMSMQQLQSRVQQAESEVQRLRQFNEALMLGTAESRHAAAAAAAQAAQAQAPVY